MKYIIDTDVVKAEAYDEIFDLIEAGEIKDKRKVGQLVGLTEAIIDLIHSKGEVFNG